MLHQNRLSEEFVVHELHADDDGEPLTEQQLWEALTRTFQSPRYQPPMLPEVATDLLAMAGRADVEVAQLVKLLEKDALLAGRVLKLCNSPLYGNAEPVRSLKAAVVRMGLAELRDVVMEASLSFRVFKTTGYSEAVDRVRLHSTAVAHLARTITRFTSFEAEYAFLCGLLHDVGYSAALVALGDAPKGAKLRPVVDLWPALAGLHETVSGSVATLWKLPAEVGMVLRLHHTLKVGDVVHPVAAIVSLAEAIAIEHGFGLVPKPKKVGGNEVASLLFGPHRIDEPAFSSVLTAKAALGLDKEQFERVQAACVKCLEQMSVA
ncbi:MAG: HDOD domain-containing protein [Archangiaceae bacterium]|nr:HDOD domain-containing protein [Archangiaceae bacterium]